jgi:hypothetical protein
MANNFQKLKLKFNLMKIFGGNTIVSPHLLESNVSEEKTLWQIINAYENSNTKIRYYLLTLNIILHIKKNFLIFLKNISIIIEILIQ